MENAENHKRIAKNSIALYVRMIFSMLVALYTSRVVLNALGVVDFGLYGVIGGVVSMLGFINIAMATGTQRFLNFEMGQGNNDRLQKVFSMSMNIHFLVAIALILLAETLGLWFLNTQMNIPYHRMDAANWTYQFSILAGVASIIQVPYSAVIMAREKMTIYAYIGIADVILKLGGVIILAFAQTDKLILYAGVIFAASAITCLINYIYCRRFAECSYKFERNKELFYGISSFSGWSLFGTLSNAFSNQGVNILINIFFNPVANAARAIAFQVYGAINNMVAGFMTAVRPQIVKSYSQGDLQQMYVLIHSSSKISFFLLFLIALPVLCETNMILTLWLKELPENTVLFTRLTIVNILFATLFEPIVGASQASGKVRNYQLVVGVQYLLNFSLTYVLYLLGFPVYTTFMLMIALTIGGLIARLYVLRHEMNFNIGQYLRRVMLPIFKVTLFTLPIPLLIVNLMPDGIFRLLLVGFVSVVLSCGFFWLSGLTHNEKSFVKETLIKPILSKLR